LVFLCIYFSIDLRSSNEISPPTEKLEYEKNAKYQSLSTSTKKMREKMEDHKKEVIRKEKEIEEKENKLRGWRAQQEERKKKWSESCTTTVELINSVYSL